MVDVTQNSVAASSLTAILPKFLQLCIQASSPDNDSVRRPAGSSISSQHPSLSAQAVAGVAVRATRVSVSTKGQNECKVEPVCYQSFWG